MTKNTIVNALFMGFGAISGLLIVFIAGLLIHERYYDHKFGATPTGITARQVRNEWGKPNSYIDYSETRIAMGYDKSVWGRYLFIMDKDSVVNQKYFDD